MSTKGDRDWTADTKKARETLGRVYGPWKASSPGVTLGEMAHTVATLTDTTVASARVKLRNTIFKLLGVPYRWSNGEVTAKVCQHCGCAIGRDDALCPGCGKQYIQ